MATIESRARKALAFTQEVAAGADNWVTVQNAVFGIGGKMSELFPTERERVAFSRTAEFEEISRTISDLRAAKGDPAPIDDLANRANGAIGLRLPKTVHAALLAEAAAEGVSLNQLCLAKLCVQLRAAVG